jgi:DNA-directed RNA polymerase subunit RPC12/RpoP
MSTLGGVRLPSLKLVLGRTFPKRLEILYICASRVRLKTPRGITQDEALFFLRYFKPAFGEIKLLRSKTDPTTGLADWKIAVDSYCCPKCRLRFDLKDVKVIYRDGVVRCPKCAEDVCRKEDAPTKLFHL